MKRSDFHYHLPPELIAQEARPRGSSRMMIVDRTAGTIRHSTFAEFPALLSPDDLLVVNDTAVFPARLFARPKGKMKNPIEFLLTRRTGPLTWTTWCKPARRVRPGDAVDFGGRLRASVIEKSQDGTVSIRFEGNSEEEVWDGIAREGVTPLPPYIRRPAGVRSDEDAAAYQTIYAAKRGAVAAPTAGLHFSPELLGAVERRGVGIAALTLHVGIGTFQPVKVEDLSGHRMESERYIIAPGAAAQLSAALESQKRIVAVGTTSVRALESAIAEGNGRFESGERETSIFITPGYRFRAVGALLTNFHLPESTLLMLVSAFAGRELTRRAYEEAIAERYLFYSFGDCMFVE